MDAELARWFRSEQRKDQKFASRHLPKDALEAKPRTQLHLIARSGAGRSFLSQRELELKEALRSSTRAENSADLAGQLGSVLHLQGKLDQAHNFFQKAIDFENQFRPSSTHSRFLCMLERVKRQIAADCYRQNWPNTVNTVSVAAMVPVPVPVRDASKLDIKVFISEYARPGLPVVLQGLVDGGMFRDGPWMLNDLSERLGDRTFVPRRRCALSPDWANLEDCPAIGVRTFIQQLQQAEKEEGEEVHERNSSCSAASRATGYLFDWNLPDSAPELCEELRIPAFFAADWLHV